MVESRLVGTISSGESVYTGERENIGYNMFYIQRGVRVVEGARLESVYTGNRIEGSNPFLSAKIKIRYWFRA